METRVKRYSKKNRIKRNIKKKVKNITLKRVLKLIARNIAYLIIGLSYAGYLVLRAFNNFVAKLFMSMPRLAKITLIYLLVLNFGNDAYKSYKNFNKNELKEVKAIMEKVKPQQEVKVEEVKAEEIKQEEVTCQYDEVSCKIYNKAKELGMTEEQSLLSIAISKWETGRYTSNLYKNHNFGGLYRNGKFMTYKTQEEGMNDYLQNLKVNYFDKGLNTVELIKCKYAPDGVENDPNNMNSSWCNGVYAMLAELTK